MHTVAILALDDLVPFDLAVPIGVFSHARTAEGKPCYNVLVCGVTATVRTGFFDLTVSHDLAALGAAQTVIVPGLHKVDGPFAPEALNALKAAAKRGKRIASICSGSFVLAAAGLLDGKTATTHWKGARELARRYPGVKVNPDVLYCDEGSILTSAGAAAGLDLCHHIVRKDFGAAVAAQAARLAVMPLERSGGQAQFIRHEAPKAEGSLEAALLWMRKNQHLPLCLSTLAKQAGMSERNFLRRFKEQTGLSPLRCLTQMRIARAQELLEASALPVERIAEETGFAGAMSFREQFKKHTGVSPRAYRKAFRAETRA